MRKKSVPISKTIRAIFLALVFFSATVPAVAQSFEVDVSLTISGSQSGLRVFAFTETGTYTGVNATTDDGGVAVFDTTSFAQGNYIFRVDFLNNQFWSDVARIPLDSSISVIIEEETVLVDVKNQFENLSGVKVYLFNSAGAYLGKSSTTDVDGMATFIVPVGMPVKFRGDHFGYQFWTDTAVALPENLVELLIPYQDVVMTVTGIFDNDYDPLGGIRVYLFKPSGTYLGHNFTTDANGQVTLSLPEATFMIRADFQHKQYWSAEFKAQNTTVEIPFADAQVTVAANGQPLENVPVYVFNQSDAYLGINKKTDSNGNVTFRLSSNDAPSVYKFRADFQNSQFWSPEAELYAHQINPIGISTGGGAFRMLVHKENGGPLENISCYAFTATGTYLGLTATTNPNGEVVFNLADGNYKFRADYMGYQFWTDVYTVPDVLFKTLSIAHTDIAVSVQKSFDDAADPVGGVPVYLFTPDDAYLGWSQTTALNGEVTFNLPDRTYKMRADYLTQPYWSNEFQAQNTIVDIPMAEAGLRVSWNDLPLEDVAVYVFNDVGTYLGISDTTDSQGQITFRLPAETYKFRADYLSNRYWSGEYTLINDQLTPIDIFTGGGTFNLTISKDQTQPLIAEKTYLFNSAGAYLGISNTTDEYGQASFDLPEGSYMFRIDTLGYQFWTDIYEVPRISSDVITIAHQDVTITIQAQDPEPSPLEGLTVYLFTPSGAYLGQNLVTDTNGQVTFNLPEQPYKVRADFLGQQFWSNDFQWQDTTLSIDRGTAALHIHLGGTDIVGATVYLFSVSGTYLGSHEITDENGQVDFLIPDRPYQFRIDYDGGQYWSNAITGAAGVTNPIDIDLTPPTVTLYAAQNVVQSGQSTTLTWSSTGAYTCTVDQGIGEVPANGSIEVSPDASTTYTITATGAGGSAIDSTSVAINLGTPDDVDLGFAVDEQHGGGGLIGESVRLLNGNALEARSDLRFPSPNGYGLAFDAVYSSRAGQSSALGYGWAHTYSASLTSNAFLNGQVYLKVVDAYGRGRYFLEGTPGIYSGAFKEKSYVIGEAGEYVWHRLDGSRFGFGVTGRLIWMEDQAGNRLILSYDAFDRLVTVIDQASKRVLSLFYNPQNLISAISGPVTAAVADGVWAIFNYDENQNLISVTYADGSGFDYSYSDANDAHNLTRKINKANQELMAWAYSAEDRCTSFSHRGATTSIEYGSDSQVTVTDAYGVVRSYTISKIDERKRMTAMAGKARPPYTASNLIRWQYDADLNLIETENYGGAVFKYQDYDSRGNPGTIILADNDPDVRRTIAHTYHPALNMPLTRTETSVLGAGNKVTTWDYDNDGNTTPNENPTALVHRVVEQGFRHDASGEVVPYEYVTTLTYNANGQVLTIDGPLTGSDDTVGLAYNADTGDLLSETWPLIGATNLSDYDAGGNPGRVTDVNGQTETITYDGRGRTTSTTHAAEGGSRSVAFNQAGFPETTTDPDNVYRSFTYTPDYGHPDRMTDMEGNYIAYSYDPQGNLIETSKYDPGDVRSSYKRWSYQSPDIPGMLWKQINAGNKHQEYRYGTNGFLTSVIDYEGNTTRYSYDSLGRVAMVTQPGNAVTNYDYDRHGNLVLVADAEGNQTAFTYDDMGRVTSRISRDSGVTNYVYDAAGNLTQKKDAKGNTVQHTFDLLNRLTVVAFPNPIENITYTYDEGPYGKGRRTGIIDQSGNMAFEFDSRGRLVARTSTVMGQTYALSRSFSPGGRLNLIAYPSGRTIAYTRYASGKMESAVTHKGANSTTLVSNLSFNPFGTPKQMATGAGGAVNSVASECDCLEVSNPGQPMEMYYKYDNNRNLKSISAAYKPWYNQDFVYDTSNRLASAIGVYGTFGFSYDKVGNRQTRTIDAETETYSYAPGSNRLIQVSGEGSQVNFTYDTNGNTIGINSRTLTYNQHNRLIRVQEGSTVLGEYSYNSVGQRIMKTVGGVTTVFHYDFDGHIIGESQIDGTFTHEYLFVDQARFAMVDSASGKLYFYVNNYLGTPFILTDENNTVMWEADYNPFGEAIVNPSSEIENNFRFAGQYYDAETGLHYNYHRYYDPKIGRYLRPDPIGLEGGINLFAYVQNNPVNLIDTIGLIWVTVEKDNDGIRNWILYIFRHFVYAYEGRVITHTDNALGSTRDLIQEWQHDEDNPCRDSEHTIGAARIIKQRYQEKPYPRPDGLWDENTKNHWAPPVGSKTYYEMPSANIQNDFNWYEPM